MPLVVYEGPEDPRDTSSEFHVRDADRNMIVLRKGVAVDVPADVAKALTGGEYEGHNFATAKNEGDVSEVDADAEAAKAAELNRQEAEEAATASAPAGGSGTTRASART